MESCLEAIAAGDGREIMQFDEDPQIQSFALKFVLRVFLVPGWADCECKRWILLNAYRWRHVSWQLFNSQHVVFLHCCFFSTAGGSLNMQACSAAPEGSDGRTVFAAQANGQLKMPKMGNYCLTMLGDAAAKADIASGADLSVAQQHRVLFIGAHGRNGFEVQ